MTAAMTRDARTKALVGELDLLRRLKNIEDVLAGLQDSNARIERLLAAHEQRLTELNDRCVCPPGQGTDIPTPDDDLCDQCGNQLGYYHGPGTDSGRICTYCDTYMLDTWHDTDWGAA